MTSVLTGFVATIAIAALAGLAMKLLRQPLIIGYILAGIIVGPAGLSLVVHGELFELFATLGVSSLLFLVGLGINPKYIRDVGSVAVIAGFAQIFVTALLALGIASVLGFPLITSLYLSVAITFSSTIVVLRLLQEKEEEDSLYGRISIGFLLVQDLVAMVIFLFITSSVDVLGWGGFFTNVVGSLLIIAALAVGFVRLLLPKLEVLIGPNRELLLLMSFAFCLVCAWGFSALGFSYELGALSAGIMLSWSKMFREIASRVEPIRDFFLVLFFAVVGSHLDFFAPASVWFAVFLFSVFALFAKPTIVYVIMARMGYTSKTALYSGLTVAQISEFSLIMVALGVSMGHISDDALTITTMVGLTTIAGSSYLMTYNTYVYRWLEPLLSRWSSRLVTIDPGIIESSDPMRVLLFGAHRLGGGILEQVQDEGVPYLVVDFDPHLIAVLRNKQVMARFGSADDSVFLDSLDMGDLKLVVSTIPDFQVNAFLISYLRSRRPTLTIVCVSHHANQAKELYALGADYVVMPPYLGRRFVVDLFKKNLFAHNKYVREKTKHLRDLAYLNE